MERVGANSTASRSRADTQMVQHAKPDKHQAGQDKNGKIDPHNVAQEASTGWANKWGAGNEANFTRALTKLA